MVNDTMINDTWLMIPWLHIGISKTNLCIMIPCKSPVMHGYRAQTPLTMPGMNLQEFLAISQHNPMDFHYGCIIIRSYPYHIPIVAPLYPIFWLVIFPIYNQHQSPMLIKFPINLGSFINPITFITFIRDVWVTLW